MKGAWIIKMSIKKDKFQKILNELAQFLDTNLEIEVYDNHQGFFVANAYDNGEPKLQNGHILLLFDEKLPPYITLESEQIEAIRELAVLWKVSENIELLKQKDVLSSSIKVNLIDYLEEENVNLFTINKKKNHFELSLTEDELNEYYVNEHFEKMSLLLFLFQSLEIKKFKTVNTLVIDLDDLNNGFNEDKHIQITSELVNELQEILLNNNEEHCQNFLSKLQNR